MNSFAKAALFAFAALGCTMASPAAADAPALFNTIEYRTNDLDALPKWKATLKRIAQEQSYYAESRSKPVRAWQAMIRGQRGKSQVRAAQIGQQLHQSVALPQRQLQLPDQ